MHKPFTMSSLKSLKIGHRIFSDDAITLIFCGYGDTITYGLGCDNTSCPCFPNDSHTIKITNILMHFVQDLLWPRSMLYCQAVGILGFPSIMGILEHTSCLSCV